MTRRRWTVADVRAALDAAVTDHPGPDPRAAADRLRAAAQHLRGLATAATDGPWTAMPDVLVGGWAVAHNPASDEGPYLADFVLASDAAYIAAVHPGVGLALAAWLESAADAAEEIGADPRALAVADQILAGGGR